MSGIYWHADEAAVKEYTSTTRNGKSVITVKIVVTDAHALGHILRELDDEMKTAAATHRSNVAEQRSAAADALRKYYGTAEK